MGIVNGMTFWPVSLTEEMGKLWNDLFWSFVPMLAANWSSKEFDVMAQMQDAFNHFVKSGQVWAMLIGLVVGYIFRSFTSY